MKSSRIFLTLLVFGALSGSAQAALAVRSFNLTQLGQLKYNANPAGQAKTPAQTAVDAIKGLGGNHVVLTPEARMSTYTSNNIVPVTPLNQREQERTGYLNLIRYIKSQGMTVGIRPIVLLSTNATDKLHWHGNIQPQDPFAWFKSLEDYLSPYALIGKLGKIDEFTVGAELYSMTVGTEDQWLEQPYGFPREWTLLIRKFKTQLGPKTRIMYDINYTDQTVNQDGTGASGGELERWRYRIVDLQPDPSNPPTMTDASRNAWNQIVELWKEIDVVGIDMYRSLMARNEREPSDYQQLVAKLEERTSQFASDIDTKLLEIDNAIQTGAPLMSLSNHLPMAASYSPKKIIVKEIGYKSCTRCFIDPFSYDNPSLELNVEHQAAGYEAFLNAFVKPNWSWMMGVSWWDMAIDPARSGPNDPGFSPRGKTHTENVLRQGWN